MIDLETAEQLVDMIRAQNWKNGGVLSVDRDEAIELVAQALRVAHAAGAVAATKSTGESMIAAFDAAMKPDQREYLDKLAKQAAEPVDLAHVVGGPRP